MFTGRSVLLICVPLMTILWLSVANAAESDEKFSETGEAKPVSFGLEYYHPMKDDRNIRTWNLNACYPIGEIETLNLTFGGMLTATYATGDITQLEGELSDGTLREAGYENDAMGIGPGIFADFRLLGLGRFSFHLDACISVILYNKDFPAGGDRYNFMERGGPVMKYAIDGNQAAGVGYHWMHVSNGQGSGSRNPSYDARGASVYYSIVF